MMKKQIFYFVIFVLMMGGIVFSCTKTEIIAPPWDPSSSIVQPTGIDDTDNLKAAFDRATIVDGEGTVTLAEGHYYIRPIIIENFYGIFKGVGNEKTVIHPLVNFELSSWGTFESIPPGSPRVFLITFVGGDPAVSEIGFQLGD